jgi:hypothetical protein
VTRRRPHDAKHPVTSPAAGSAAVGARVRMVEFLVERLEDELAQLWERDERSGAATRPGLAAQVAVLDEVLVTLRSGHLPPRRELRMLLFAYGRHQDYDPDWTRLLTRMG